MNTRHAGRGAAANGYAALRTVPLSGNSYSSPDQHSYAISRARWGFEPVPQSRVLRTEPRPPKAGCWCGFDQPLEEATAYLESEMIKHARCDRRQARRGCRRRRWESHAKAWDLKPAPARHRHELRRTSPLKRTSPTATMPAGEQRVQCREGPTFPVPVSAHVGGMNRKRRAEVRMWIEESDDGITIFIES